MLLRRVAAAEVCLRDLHAAAPGGLGPWLAQLPREIVGRVVEVDKGFRLGNMAVRMDRDAALSSLRISRPVRNGKQSDDDDEWTCHHIIRLPSLRHLTLFNAPNPSYCLIAAAARCTLLRHLSLTFNVALPRATAYDIEAMSAALSDLTALESLHLAGLGQRSGSVLLPTVTGKLTGLRALRLVWRDDVSHEVQDQVPLLGRLTALRQLGLHNCHDVSRDDGEFPPLLPGGPSSVRISGHTAEWIVQDVLDVFLPMPRKLSILDLSNNSIPVAMNLAQIGAGLTELIVRGSKDTSPGFGCHLRRGIASMQSLQRLDMSGTRTITWLQLVGLFSSLSKGPRALRVLNLSGVTTPMPGFETLPPEGRVEELEQLEQSLRQMRSLQELDLSDNLFNDRVAAAVAASLSALSELAQLDMSKNKLGSPGVAALIAAAGRGGFVCLRVT